MTKTTNLKSQPLYISLTVRMLAGAAIGLVLISLFIFPGDADPSWGKYWIIRPLIIVPFAGAVGGLCNHLLIRFYFLVGLNKVMAWILSVIIFIVGLWMGIVLGLDGTLWN